MGPRALPGATNVSHAVPRGVSTCRQRCEPLCPAQEPQKPLHESLCRCGRAAASHARAAPPTGRLFAAHQKHHPPPAHPPFPGDMVPPPTRPSSSPLDQGSQNVPRQALLKPPLVHSSNLQLSIMDEQHPPPHPSRSRLSTPLPPPNTQPGATSHMVPSPCNQESGLCRRSSVETPGTLPGFCASVSQTALQLLCTQQSSWSTQTHGHHLFVHIKPAPLSVIFPSAGKKKWPQSRPHLRSTQRGAQGITLGGFGTS